ncbi:hypothetical protein FRC17_002317 [Serendipita sp. 399]|nr:hypothetical protein FRC17_002317 [Serendipita sp. 399]
MNTNVRDDAGKQSGELNSLDMDIQSLSLLLASLENGPKSSQVPFTGYSAQNAGISVNGNPEGEAPSIEDEETLQQLLERIHAADVLASDVEGKVDMLLENLEQLLGALDQKNPQHGHEEPQGQETEASEVVKPEESTSK